MRTLISALPVLLATVAGPVPATGQEDPRILLGVRETVLENGLRLLVLPRPGAPIVSFVVQYRVGSVDEREGETGIAHLLEHLFFKGTTSVGTRNLKAELPLHRAMDSIQDAILALERGEEADSARIQAMREEIRFLEELASTFVVSNEMDALLSGAGARGLNATTSEESTTYYVEIPANRAELWFALEGDRMANPVFREFYAERDVVAEERRLRLETNSGGVLYEAHMAAAFRVHPYGKPVIGSMADLQRLTRRQVEGHFRRYYGPGNAVVAVVGAVDPDQIARWARRYLGPLSSGEPPPPVLAREPEQVGERRVEVAFDAEPLLRLGWRIPPVDHEDGPALAVLSSVLAGGRSSRLYRRLILEDRIASGVVATMGPGRLYPGLFSVDATPRSPHTAAEVEAAIYQELERLAASPPDLSELEGIRNQLEAAEVRRLRSNLGLALQLAESASLLGEWDAGFRFNARMQEVAPEDIQRVARAYFAPEGRTVATLVKPGVPSPDPGARRTP